MPTKQRKAIKRQQSAPCQKCSEGEEEEYFKTEMYICWTGRQSKASHDCKVAAERFKSSAASHQGVG